MYHTVYIRTPDIAANLVVCLHIFVNKVSKFFFFKRAFYYSWSCLTKTHGGIPAHSKHRAVKSSSTEVEIARPKVGFCRVLLPSAAIRPGGSYLIIDGPNALQKEQL